MIFSLGGLTGCNSNVDLSDKSAVIVEDVEPQSQPQVEVEGDDDAVNVADENNYTVADLEQWKSEYDEASDEGKTIIAIHVKHQFETFDLDLIEDPNLKAFLIDILKGEE